MITINPLNLDSAACVDVFVKVCGQSEWRPARGHVNSLYPSMKPPLNPSIKEGERRNRAKKKRQIRAGRGSHTETDRKPSD
jgi:hypothetical protein